MDYLSILNQKKPALIMSLPGNNVELARVAVEAGADVIKVHMNVQHRASGLHFGTFEEEKETLAQIREIAGDRPCGIVAGNSIEDVERDCFSAAELGYSFVSLYATATPLSVLAYPHMKKMIALAVDGITSLSVKPLRMIMGFGVFVAMISFIGVIWAVVTALLGHAVSGWASMTSIICFVSGVQLVGIGVLGEYIGKIYLEVKARPRYIISQKTGGLGRKGE